MKLHDGELDIDAGLVGRLVAGQFPRWAGLPVAVVGAQGTDNLLFRLGDDLVVRLPRRRGSQRGVRKEHRWLPWLAARLPVAVPELVGAGVPAEGYPEPWSVYRWLDGDHDFTDLAATAVRLGRFVAALQRLDPAGAPRAYRGGPLTGADAQVRQWLRQVDAPGAAGAWDRALRAPAWAGPPVWSHSDLLPGNLLARGGRLHAVLDFACAGVGDPACDLLPAWALLDARTRPLFRAELGVDDATWERGRGWALAMGLGAWAYYPVTKPAFAALGHHTVNQVLTDPASST